MSHPIHPPAYKPTELEHRAAYLKCILRDIVYEELLFQSMIRDPNYASFFQKLRADKPGDEHLDGEKRLVGLLDRLFKNDEDRDGEAWERSYDYEKFKTSYEADLADSHCGDCTAVACPCSRCHAEDLYEVTRTVTWKGKHEGWKLYNEFRAQEKSACEP